MKVRFLFLGWMVSLFLASGSARAQEAVPVEQVREFARRLTEGTASIPDAPVKVETDPERPQSLRWEGGSALIVPDRKLSATVLAEAGENVVPIGRMILRNTVLVTDGAPVSPDKIRRVPVGTESESTFQVPLLLLAAKKNAEGRLDLLVLSKDAEPLVRVPLGKVPRAAKFPIELSVEKDESGGPGTLTLNIAAQYEAELAVRRSEAR